jgi:hypothetical protein
VITRNQALGLDVFHVSRPGDTCEVWRRNGGTHTWVTRPDAFRTPVKSWLRTYGQLTENGLHVRGRGVLTQVHIEADCPCRQATVVAMDRADPIVFG